MFEKKSLPTLSEEDNVVTFHLNADGMVYSLHHTNDDYLSRIVDSFDMGNILVTEKNSYPSFFIQSLQAIFYLNDLDKIKVNLISKNDILPNDLDKEILLTQHAIDVILKKLYLKGCVNKDVVTFQARKGTYGVSNVELSPISFIYLNPNMNLNDSFTLKMREDTVSHTYAYLSQKRVCIFFNPLTKEQNDKIYLTLKEFIRERNHVPSIEHQEITNSVRN